MRVKEDVYNGNYSYLWFTPIRIGESRIFCTEYCGTGHSEMIGKLKVVSRSEYNDYINDKADLPPAEIGQKLFEANCQTCHTLDGTPKIGPSMQALFSSGKKHEMEGGEEVEVDENYVRESILNSKAKIVKGYQPLMPAFEGQFDDKQIESLIAYLKTL